MLMNNREPINVQLGTQKFPEFVSNLYRPHMFLGVLRSQSCEVLSAFNIALQLFTESGPEIRFKIGRCKSPISIFP